MFFLAAAVGACLFGIGKSIAAAADNSDAEEMNDEAEGMVDEARRAVEAARLKSSKELELLGLEKVAAWQGPLSHFLKTINKLQNVDMDKISVSVEGKKLSKETLSRMEVAYKEVEHAFGIGAGTLAAGAGAALVSYAAVGAFASAGTGAAIAGLSGAAATNATLAWLGGGALAAGGFGVAGGMCVLGGMVAAPMLLVLGFMSSAKAKENLANARSNLAKAKKVKSQADVMIAACNGISERTSLFWLAIEELSNRADAAVDLLDADIKELGRDYLKFTTEAKKHVGRAIALAQSLWSLCDVPILDENGKLTVASANALKDQKLLNA